MRTNPETPRAMADATACTEPDDGHRVDARSALAAMLAAVRDAVLVCDGGEVVAANPPAAALFGRENDIDALRGARVDALLAPAPVATSARPEPRIARVLGLRRERRVAVRTRSVGDVTVHVLSDVDERRQPQGALDESARELEETRLAAAALQARVEAEVEERRELVAVVAHELRTPITVIRGYARLLLAGEVGELNEQQVGFIEASAKSCDRLDEFVGMLLRATDAQRAADAYHFADASLASLFAGAIDFMRPLIDELGVRVELELDPEALWAHFDVARVEQVLVNLIQNGLKYAADGGVLSVRTRPAPEPVVSGEPAIEISVSDCGPGIPAERRGGVFDPYVRGDDAAAVPGLGLGLAICRRIVEVHGGRIEVREEPGGGCCFAFTLAAAEPKDPVDHPESGDR